MQGEDDSVTRNGGNNRAHARVDDYSRQGFRKGRHDVESHHTNNAGKVVETMLLDGRDKRPCTPPYTAADIGRWCSGCKRVDADHHDDKAKQFETEHDDISDKILIGRRSVARIDIDGVERNDPWNRFDRGFDDNDASSQRYQPYSEKYDSHLARL